MKKVLAFMLVSIGTAATCPGQGTMDQWLNDSYDYPAQKAQLFALNPQQYNHHIELPLPDNGLLKIDFLRLSDWTGKDLLKSTTETAAQQVNLLKDSFKSNYSTKLLALNIPVDGNIISVQYAEDEKDKNQLAFKNGEYYQLKSGFDTIRVVRNIGVRTKPLVDSGLIQVQFTYIVKDINDLVKLESNQSELERLNRLMEDAVNEYRNRWNNQDARTHHLTLNYDAKKDKLTKVSDDGVTGIFKYLGIYVSVGANFYSGNSVSPYVEETIAFLIPGRSMRQHFVGLGVNAFGFVNQNGVNASFTSYNFEFGTCKKGSAFMSQKTSMMLGLMHVIRPDGVKYNLFNIGFTFGINTFLSVGFNAASDFKKNSDKSVFGVNFKFNL
jgi:hypothetical protein